MGELRNPLSLGLPATGFGSSQTFGSDELIDSLEITLRRVREMPPGISPPLVRVARPVLTALTRIRTSARFAAISDHIARDFHLGSDRLQSRSREQRQK